MFSSGPAYSKLKTNLRITINRLKLLEKKKTEMAMKARKEIADYISSNKEDRARIRVEHIIREDYLVEGMELLEMYCDLLLARFGLIETQKEIDSGLIEAIASIIWATPRLQAEVNELRVISEQLVHKYGKEFAEACRSNSLGHVNEKLQHKLSVHAPSKLLVEKYMMEIAKIYNVPFEPDESVMKEDEVSLAEGYLIDLDKSGSGAHNDHRGPGGGSGGGGGGSISAPMVLPATPEAPQHNFYTGGGMPPPQQQSSAPPPVPSMPPVGPPVGGVPLPYPTDPSMGGMPRPPPPSYNTTMDQHQMPHAPPFTIPGAPYPAGSQPTLGPGGPPVDPGAGPLPTKKSASDFELPDVPSDLPSLPGGGGGSEPAAPKNDDDEVDFDDLTRRFEQLKKKK